MTEVTSDLICYRRHLRMAQLCGQGSRPWWVQHGLDWSDFLTNGIAAEKLLATGDPLAKRVVEVARREQDGR